MSATQKWLVLTAVQSVGVKMRSIMMLTFVFWLAACTPARGAEPGYPAYDEATDISPGEGPGAQWQSEEEIGNLGAALETQERDTFAGLWLQHQPSYRVVVAFTEGGEETIAKYVTADSELAHLIELRQVSYTYAQLQSDLATSLMILNEIGFSASSDVNVMENQVELYITDRARFERLLAEANAALPESVVAITVYEPVVENPPFSITPAPNVFMPQLIVRDYARMTAELIGELVVENGCLRVKTEFGGYLVIWQADYFLTEQDGRIHILNEHGEIVATVGETIHMGGGEIPQVATTELRAPIPEPCGGPYWRMGGLVSSEQ